MSEERKRWVDPVVLLDRKFKPDAVLWREATARRAEKRACAVCNGTKLVIAFDERGRRYIDDCAYCPQPSKEPA